MAAEGDLRFDERGVPIHSPAFRRRRFANWFPLGILYAFYYMARYNITVSKTAICDQFDLSNEQWGVVITAGFWTYAFSFLLNGPLTDRLGGRWAIITGAVGSAAVNLLIAALVGFADPTDLADYKVKVILALACLYAANMYFQSYGALAIVKVNAAWFHVRERGVFGGIFGILISSGLFVAYQIGGLFVATLELVWVFVIPACILVVLVMVNRLLVRNSPEDAGLPRLRTGDATDGEEDQRASLREVIFRIVRNRVVRIIALAEFCTGVVRNGVMQWLPAYIQDAKYGGLGLGHESTVASWFGLGMFAAGVLGGLAAGIVSDRFFGSRRPPVAGIFYIFIIGMLALLGLAVLSRAHGYVPDAVGAAWLALATGTLTAFLFIGVHGVLSGTASMDFGGRKAAATAAGMIDGMVYLGSGLAGAPLGWVLDRWGYSAWAFVLMPFALIGFFLTTRIWREMPKSAKGAAGH